MNALYWVIALALATGVGASIAGPDDAATKAIWFGIAGPVVLAGASWMVTARTWAKDKAALLPVMMRAFAVKAMVVVAYVVVVVKVMDARPMPFFLSFIATYLVTHLAEAICLRRLMAGM
jgi:hypothetical protein